MQTISAEKLVTISKYRREELKRIPSTGPSITQKEIDLVLEAVTHGWYENMNMHINQFV